MHGWKTLRHDWQSDRVRTAVHLHVAKSLLFRRSIWYCKGLVTCVWRGATKHATVWVGEINTRSVGRQQQQRQRPD